MPLELAHRLEAHLSQFPTAPFLFIGSGISRRYLNLETWNGLLARFCDRTTRPFDYFRTCAGGSLPRLASALAEEFHEIWWKDSEYSLSRDSFAKDAKNRESALKYEIATYIQTTQHQALAKASAKRDRELGQLSKAVIDGVITTNWDQLIETLFPDFKVFIGQDELLFSAPQGIGEVYKIHGCISQPNSLVLTGSDYDRFNERNPYLAAKLLAVFVEHPVIFLGYSLSDDNILTIIRSIASCLTSDNIDQLRNRLVFVQWERGEAQSSFSATSIVAEGTNIPILFLQVPDFLPVFDALAGLRRRFPARVLRQLKEHVYELVRDNDPKTKLYVKDIDDAGDAAENIEVVFGVGVISDIRGIGYRGVTREDLVRDVLYQDKDFDAKRIVEEALPRICRANRYVPVFRYLKLAGFLDRGALRQDVVVSSHLKAAAQTSISRFDPPRDYSKKRDAIKKRFKSFGEMVATMKPGDVVLYAPLLDSSVLNISDVRDFLISNSALTSQNALMVTQYYKLVCLYDFLTR